MRLTYTVTLDYADSGADTPTHDDLARLIARHLRRRQVVVTVDGPDAPTPNGYDSRWIEAVNGALEDRESDARIGDLDDHLWERWIGPMLDDIEGVAPATMEH